MNEFIVFHQDRKRPNKIDWLQYPEPKETKMCTQGMKEDLLAQTRHLHTVP